jgi:acetylserotonin N-methyltransferase
MAGYILYSNSALFPMWSDLEGALREGRPRWEPVFGFPPSGLFEHFFRTDEKKREFLLGMHGFGRLTSDAVVSAFDLTRFRRFIDLGGGTGHLAMAAASRYPALKTAVFDLPAAVEFAREFVDDRVELIGGDFFLDRLPEADLYGLGRILHDWSEDKIRPLLRRIHAALPPGGGLLIAEILLDDDKRGPVDAHMQSLNMLVCTEGRERSLAEYRALLESEGFTGVRGHRTGTPLDAVLALKPA